ARGDRVRRALPGFGRSVFCDGLGDGRGRRPDRAIGDEAIVAAVVFDLDGVLIDSEETWSRVRGEVVARHGGHWTEADQRNVMGDNSRQWSAYIKRTWNIPLSEEEIFREVLATMIAAYERELTVLPGAVEAVAELGARYPLAVASSSPGELIGVALRVAGFDGAFRATVSSDEVPHGKPAPNVYLL